jgi:hypothetical protein
VGPGGARRSCVGVGRVPCCLAPPQPTSSGAAGSSSPSSGPLPYATLLTCGTQHLRTPHVSVLSRASRATTTTKPLSVPGRCIHAHYSADPLPGVVVKRAGCSSPAGMDGPGSCACQLRSARCKRHFRRCAVDCARSTECSWAWYRRRRPGLRGCRRSLRCLRGFGQGF